MKNLLVCGAKIIQYFMQQDFIKNSEEVSI